MRNKTIKKTSTEKSSQAPTQEIKINKHGEFKLIPYVTQPSKFR